MPNDGGLLSQHCSCWKARHWAHLIFIFRLGTNSAVCTRVNCLFWLCDLVLNYSNKANREGGGFSHQTLLFFSFFFCCFPAACYCISNSRLHHLHICNGLFLNVVRACVCVVMAKWCSWRIWKKKKKTLCGRDWSSHLQTGGVVGHPDINTMCSSCLVLQCWVIHHLISNK